LGLDEEKFGQDRPQGRGSKDAPKRMRENKETVGLKKKSQKVGKKHQSIQLASPILWKDKGKTRGISSGPFLGAKIDREKSGIMTAVIEGEKTSDK